MLVLHPADAAARPGTPDGLEFAGRHRHLHPAEPQRILEGLILVDLELFAQGGKDHCLADVEQGIAHPLQIAKDVEAGNGVFRRFALAQVVEDGVEGGLEPGVQGEFRPADAQPQAHVLTGEGRIDQAQGLVHVDERIAVLVAPDEVGIGQVLDLRNDVDGVVGNAFQVDVDDVGRAHDVQGALVDIPGTMDAAPAGVFDHAFEVVDVVVAALDAAYPLRVRPLHHEQGARHLLGHLKHHEAEILLDALQNTHAPPWP